MSEIVAEHAAPEPAPVPVLKLTLAQWKEVELACTDPANPISFTEAETKFGVSKKTISRRAIAHNWPIPRIINRAINKKIEQGLEKVAMDWHNRAEKHRDVAFNLAHESMKKMKPRAPKNFREAEAADKIARRAAGLDVSEINQQTLIQINEAIDAHELVTPAGEEDDVVEATVLPAEEPVES